MPTNKSVCESVGDRHNQVIEILCHFKEDVYFWIKEKYPTSHE